MNKPSFAAQTQQSYNITEHFGPGVIFLDEDKTIMHWNDWFNHHTNLDLTDYQNQNFFNVFPSLTATKIDSGIKKSLKHGIPTLISNKDFNNAFPLYHLEQLSDGEENPEPILQSINIDRVLIGKLNYCMITISDVTNVTDYQKIIEEKKLIEISSIHSLELDNSLYKRLVNHLIDGCIVFNQCGQIEMVNLAAEKLFDDTEQKLIGKNISQLIKFDNTLQKDLTFADIIESSGSIGTHIKVTATTQTDNNIKLDFGVNKISIDENVYYCALVRDLRE